MAKELRITFKDSEMELYNFIKSRSSYSGFLKDLAMIEQQRLNNYINGFSNSYRVVTDVTDNITNNINDEPVGANIKATEPIIEPTIDEFDIDLDDII